MALDVQTQKKVQSWPRNASSVTCPSGWVQVLFLHLVTLVLFLGRNRWGKREEIEKEQKEGKKYTFFNKYSIFYRKLWEAHTELYSWHRLGNLLHEYQVHETKSSPFSPPIPAVSSPPQIFLPFLEGSLLCETNSCQGALFWVHCCAGNRAPGFVITTPLISTHLRKDFSLPSWHICLHPIRILLALSQC